MNTRIWYILLMCIVPKLSFSGIDDHTIYDSENRHTLVGLDALVEVEVINYYAFSEPTILFNYINEMNRFRSSEEDYLGVVLESPSPYWVPEPYLNAYSIIRRHAVWVIDARVTSCLDGECKAKFLRIAFQDSPAFTPKEYPSRICVRDENVDRIVLGLVWVEEDEFKLAFRDKLCFLKDGLDVFKFNKGGAMLPNGGYPDYENTFNRSSLTSSNDGFSTNSMTYCVVRDLNVHESKSNSEYAFVEEDMARIRGYTLLEKGPLVKALESALADEKKLMDSMGIKEPLPDPLVKDREEKLRDKMQVKGAAEGQ